MGIDHVIDLDCAAKRALGPEGIGELVKCRSRAETVLAIARQNGDARPAAEISFQVAVQRPSGVETTDVSVQALFDRAAALDGHRGGCAQCPANGGQAGGFGCYRSIAYPIEVETEQWLWSRLPTDSESTARQFLSRGVVDFGWDGAQAAQMRAQGGTFFESTSPISGRWPDGFSFDTNQLFHIMFQVGHLGSTHCLMLACFLGMLPHDLDPNILRDPNRRGQLLAMAAVPPQRDQVEQMADFLRSIVMSARLEAELLIDG